MKRWIRRATWLVILMALVGGATWWWTHRNGDQKIAFRTTQVRRDSVLVAIGSTGTLEPEEVVNVGAQVGGRILSLGKGTDGTFTDYTSEVAEGAVLATIDDTLYQADLSEAQSQVKSARAAVQRSQADVKQLKAKLLQAERDWARAQKLGPSEALAQATYDSYESAYETAKANVEVGEAAMVEAEAALAQSENSLWRAQRNLGYCTITSPVHGVIIDRRVNVGQTVNASMSAPSLFLIAKDLKRMQIWVAVNEADVGRIRPGQPVTYTVDAFPNRTFTGEVRKVRLNASMTQNVVTYTVEIAAENGENLLLPYLTANVRFQIERKDNVLTVPASALRWTPTTEQTVPEFRGKGLGPSIVWVADGALVRPVQVRVGLSDGTISEVAGEGLTDGMSVITGVEEVAAAPNAQAVPRPTTQDSSANGAAASPFLPNMPKPPKGGMPGGM